MKEVGRAANNRILVIDDNPAIHADIRKILKSSGTDTALLDKHSAMLFGEESAKPEAVEFEIDSAYQGREGLAKVESALEAGRPYALAFVDVRMPPGWSGVETIHRIWQQQSDLQIVICTAYSDYSWEEMTKELGNSDSLVILKKPFDNIEVVQLAHALTNKWCLNEEVKSRLQNLDELVRQRTGELQSSNEQLKLEIVERAQVEKALRLSEERFSKAFRASPIPLAIQSLKHETFADANQGFEELIGFSRAELVGRKPGELNIWGDVNEATALISKLQYQMPVRNLPRKLRTKAGQMRDTLVSAELIELEGEPFILTITQDITEQIKLENQLRESQKMEAVGQLAAGVAHDFNNILTVILGNASLLLHDMPDESDDRKIMEVITVSAERASKLVRQLLTFSRKQIIEARPMKISDTLTMVSEMLPRVLGDHITVKMEVADGLPTIRADAGMMEQMLLNLAINARDAMPHGGELTITADEVEAVPESEQGLRDCHPGQFLRLRVADNGCGIPAELLARIFEPFFSTKPVGKGTGLGLASVYGIAKTHGGWVEVRSEVGKGSTFSVFIPVCKDAPREACKAA